MAVKTFNYTNDAYIEAIDTRSELGAMVGNAGNGFFGTIAQVGTTNSYTVKAGTVVFAGGLCIRVLSDETFDLTSLKYIVVETIYQPITDGYTCLLKAVNVLDATTMGTVKKHVPIYQKGVGLMNEGKGLTDVLKKARRADCFWSGGMYMDEGHRLTFPNLETNDYQMLYLVFSHYTVGTGADNWGWLVYPIPVEFIISHPGEGHSVTISVEDTTKVMYKYIYVGINAVSGSSNNVRILDGVNFRSKCLREIWGVG
ncbi:hypothetical protein PWEIH_00690 [Listeria weihenstephanensis FSL R9-0317]|uniref:Uncharacterized protein n=1 Tax=Listeria weihenstephanensis TaxID=1006155 RepID=A0A1S7FT43_9LIST|nr:hypothetical protein [Listeria weihenstephanensis]AQY50515.1 hypothetical protein UE46_05380 [Listeria phage LWP01] [Listeria weihenstephanensis]AQY52661.1 hypothetical protein UE46_p05380 [Listeria phage LWP01]EUJ41534.1 hypothetical protein PWEIH_00690 [Listeria weihenstephanensis FSL R9-0317]